MKLLLIAGIITCLSLNLYSQYEGRVEEVDDYEVRSTKKLRKPTNVRLTDHDQDIEFLKNQVNQLKLDMERLTLENAEMEQQLAFLQNKLAGNISGYVELRDLNDRMNEQRNEFLKADQKQKIEIINEVSKQMNSFFKKAGKSNASISVTNKPQIPDETIEAFTDDYPKEGIEYIVQSGDTLSGIAKKFGSNVIDIQNANKLKDPRRDLKAGATIFIPQQTEE